MDLTLCTGYTEAHTYSHGGTLGFWIQSTLFYWHGQQEKSIPAGMFVCVWIELKMISQLINQLTARIISSLYLIIY